MLMVVVGDDIVSEIENGGRIHLFPILTEVAA